MARKFRVLSLGVFLMLLSICASGQDLGSSNKLFGETKPASSPSTSAKKVSTKARHSVSKAKVSVRNVKKKNTAARKVEKAGSPPSDAAAAVKPKFTEYSPARPSKVEITVGRPTESSMATGTAADKLFVELIDSGNAARDERNYRTAEAAYKRAQNVKPTDSRAIYGLGNVYSDQQRWDDAESAYRAAIKIDPNDATAHIALSYVLTQPISTPKLSDRYDEAEKLARRAIQLAPSNSLAHDQLGVALELGGLIGSETESAYRKAIQLDPSFAPSYAHLGRLLRRRGLIKESAVAYKSALERATDVGAKVLVAEIMQSEQRFAESEPLLKSALQDDPKNPAALLMFGRAQAIRGNYAEAERIFKKNLEVSPNGFAATSQLGSMYLMQGKCELAENILLQGIRFVSASDRPRFSEQFELVGDLYMKTSKRDNAERAYKQALTLDSGNESVAGKLASARRN